jgi:hypothetical protein
LSTASFARNAGPVGATLLHATGSGTTCIVHLAGTSTDLDDVHASLETGPGHPLEFDGPIAAADRLDLVAAVRASGRSSSGIGWGTIVVGNDASASAFSFLFFGFV